MPTIIITSYLIKYTKSTSGLIFVLRRFGWCDKKCHSIINTWKNCWLATLKAQVGWTNRVCHKSETIGTFSNYFHAPLEFFLILETVITHVGLKKIENYMCVHGDVTKQIEYGYLTIHCRFTLVPAYVMTRKLVTFKRKYSILPRITVFISAQFTVFFEPCCIKGKQEIK